MNWQRGYFRCAAVWLACRLEVLSGRRWLHPDQSADLQFALLGEHDYRQEMRLILDERRKA